MFFESDKEDVTMMLALIASRSHHAWEKVTLDGQPEEEEDAAGRFSEMRVDAMHFSWECSLVNGLDQV